ncbi:MAG: hypothetical protein IMZ44_07380 [Planctomycetes bacterium]|nr:hypothetical protein [Planctomycetota bacterium]
MGALLAAPLAVFSCIGYALYLAGLKNQAYPVFFVMSSLCFLAFVMVALLSIVIARVIWYLKGSGWRSTGLRLGSVILGIVAIVTLWEALISVNPTLLGLRERILDRADFDEIRAWGKAHPGFRGAECVDGLDLAMILVSEDGSSLLFRWGNEWQGPRALVVGPVNSRVPDRRMVVADSVYMVVADGVYLLGGLAD